jgi:hypothetical protein
VTGIAGGITAMLANAALQGAASIASVEDVFKITFVKNSFDKLKSCITRKE